jgi:hypothetical protein
MRVFGPGFGSEAQLRTEAQTRRGKQGMRSKQKLIAIS